MAKRLPVGTLVVHTGDHDNNHHNSISNTSEMKHTKEKTDVFNSMLIPIAEKYLQN